MTKFKFAFFAGLIFVMLAVLASCGGEDLLIKDIATGEDGSIVIYYADGSNKTISPEKPGKSVASAAVNADGELVVTYSDGSSDNLGKISGEDGKDGAKGTEGGTGAQGPAGQQGKDGRGILKVEINAKGELIITYTDNTHVNLGKISDLPGEKEPEITDGWTQVDEPVYVHNCKSVNTRSTPDSSDSSNLVGYLMFGAEVRRLAYNDSWSLVVVGGEEVYVSSRRLTTDDGSVTFTAVDEFLMLKNTWNMKEWTELESNTTKSFKEGDTLWITGISKNGEWARIEYLDSYGKTKVVYGHNPSEHTAGLINIFEIVDEITIQTKDGYTANFKIGDTSIIGENSAGKSMTAFTALKFTDTDGVIWTVTSRDIIAERDGTNLAILSGYFAENGIGKKVRANMGAIITNDGRRVTVNANTVEIVETDGSITTYIRYNMDLFKLFFLSFISLSPTHLDDEITEEEMNAVISDTDKLIMTETVTIKDVGASLIEFFKYNGEIAIMLINGEFEGYYYIVDLERIVSRASAVFE